jgi:hypothetical protein
MNTPMTLKQILDRDAESVYDTTRKLFGLVDDGDLAWKPTTGGNWMTVGQLLMHCANFGCGKAVQGFVTGDWGVPDGSGAEVSEADQHLPQHLSFMIDHLAQHKGQLYYYLKLMGRDVGTGDLWGALP